MEQQPLLAIEQNKKKGKHLIMIKYIIFYIII